MKLHYPKSHYDKSSRGQVFPLLKPFIKGDDFTDAQRIKQYYVSEKDFEFIDNIEEAEFVILTMAWNYYVKNNKTDKAISFVNECDKKGKRVLTWNSGDHGVRIPILSNLIVVRQSGYHSKFSPYIVCVRGGGNFSVRFYEAMAMGRIPVFINTDCSLPFYDDVDWKKHVVWVEYKERHQVAQKVKDFHEGLSERDFIDLQLANRSFGKIY